MKLAIITDDEKRILYVIEEEGSDAVGLQRLFKFLKIPKLIKDSIVSAYKNFRKTGEVV